MSMCFVHCFVVLSLASTHRIKLVECRGCMFVGFLKVVLLKYFEKFNFEQSSVV